ncbi:MAG: F0F1 ATP synthase subunit epsilon [Ruminococcaceae bacterium]|nr:F0F1 ATP synthase subunit epsilon [Oscillospiraceae bacterium]
MNTFTLLISSPEGELFRGEVVNLSVRGVAGDLAVMAGHIPFVTTVKPCRCRIELGDGTEKAGETDGGLLTVGKELVTLLVGSLEWKDA